LYSDWPTFAHDNSRSGYSDSFIQTPIAKIWETEIPGEILSSPVIYKNKVFVTTRFGYVVALDLKTGDWLWDYSTAGFNDST
ncbi:MAG: PQQ-binding-like beta-propeller repeat protein, partial [Elusimicrobiales bacterium]|nr:PQQ-binding-like beta-propeller repeat protein [Elusimicrobiales bacterium]